MISRLGDYKIRRTVNPIYKLPIDAPNFQSIKPQWVPGVPKKRQIWSEFSLNRH